MPDEHYIKQCVREHNRLSEVESYVTHENLCEYWYFQTRGLRCNDPEIVVGNKINCGQMILAACKYVYRRHLFENPILD